MIIMERFIQQTKELMGHKTCLPMFQSVSLMFFFFFHFWGVGLWVFVVFLLPEKLLPRSLTVQQGKKEEAGQ